MERFAFSEARHMSGSVEIREPASLIILEGPEVNQSLCANLGKSVQGTRPLHRDGYVRIVYDEKQHLSLLDYLKCEIVDEGLLRRLEGSKQENEEFNKSQQFVLRQTNPKNNEHNYELSLEKKTKKRKGDLEARGLRQKAEASCQLCGVAVLRIDLKKHEALHIGTKPYSCHLCEQRFTSLSSRASHIRSIHDKSEEYQCPICSKGFNQKSNMVKHYRSIHLDALSAECGLCNRKFNQTSALRRHIKIVHKKELPYSCELCNKKFSQAETLKKHKDSVHLKSRGFPCEYCEYATSRADMLRIHVRKIHTKEWKYWCKLCKEKGHPWGCILPKELRRHMKTRHPEHNLQLDRKTELEKLKRESTGLEVCSPVRSVEDKAQDLLNQLKEPLQFSSQLEAEVRDRACRAPLNVLKVSQDQEGPDCLEEMEKQGLDAALDPGEQQNRINVIYQDQTFVLAVDSEGRTRQVAISTSLRNQSEFSAARRNQMNLTSVPRTQPALSDNLKNQIEFNSGRFQLDVIPNQRSQMDLNRTDKTNLAPSSTVQSPIELGPPSRVQLQQQQASKDQVDLNPAINNRIEIDSAVRNQLDHNLMMRNRTDLNSPLSNQLVLNPNFRNPIDIASSMSSPSEQPTDYVLS